MAGEQISPEIGSPFDAAAREEKLIKTIIHFGNKVVRELLFLYANTMYD